MFLQDTSAFIVIFSVNIGFDPKTDFLLWKQTDALFYGNKTDALFVRRIRTCYYQLSH